MDIRPPKHPIVSLRAFVLEMGTITCGIMIALGLEAAVRQYESNELRHQAVVDFRAELSANQDELTAIGSDETSDIAMLRGLIAYGTARLAHRPLPPSPALRGRAFTDLSASAWATALATQAVGQLSHAQVSALESAYGYQAVFNDLSAKSMNQWLQVAGYSGQPEQIADADIPAALRDVRIAAAYTITLSAMRAELMTREATALKLLAQ